MLIPVLKSSPSWLKQPVEGAAFLNLIPDTVPRIFGDYPNIFGEWANTHAANPGAFVLGASYFRDIENPIRMSTLNETASAHMGFNASRVSSLYQNDLTEVRVNALCGYMLIRYA